MAINAELFDGTILEFPDGTDPSVIQATAKRMTLERQMAGGEMPRNDLGEIVEKDPQGSKAYQAIKSLVDPIRPYVEPAVDYVGEQASLAAGAGLKGVANLQTSIAQNQIAGMMELQEARKAKYGTFENMPPEEQQNYLKAQKYIEGKLQDVAKLGVEKKDIEKKYGVRESTKALDSLSQSPEYKDASFIDKMTMIGSKIADDPFGIITDLGLESIPQSYAIASAAIATRFGMLNPKIAAGVGGSSSAMMQFGNEYAALREQGLDHKEAWEKAGVKSGVVGLFDAASFYSAGKAAGAVMDNIKKGAVKETVKEVAKETGKQAGLGAAGEGFGSAAIGQEVDPLELTKEAIGEIFGAPGDAISTYQGKVAEARAAGKPDPEPPANVAKLMADKGFTFKKREEFVEAPQIDITGVGQVPEEPPVIQGLPEEELIADLEESQDRQAMLAELEEERDIDRQLKQVSVQEITPEEEKAAPAEPVAIKAMPKEEFMAKVQNPEIAGELQAMAANAGWAEVGGRLLREDAADNTSKVIGRTQWIPKEEWWRGRPKGMTEAKTAKAVQKAIAGETLNVAEKRMIEYMVNVAEGNLARIDEERAALEESDRKVAQFEQERRTEEALDIAKKLEQIGQTGPAQAIVKGIQDGQVVTPAAIEFLREKFQELSQPAPMELTGQTPDEARAEAEALELQRAEEQRVASEQQRAEQEARDRAEITRRSEAAAEDFQLGQTAEENLTGQKDIFAETKAPEKKIVSLEKVVREKQWGALFRESFDNQLAELNDLYNKGLATDADYDAFENAIKSSSDQMIAVSKGYKVIAPIKKRSRETTEARKETPSANEAPTKSDIDAAIEDGINRYAAAMAKNGVKVNDTPATMGGRADAALRKVIDNIEAKLKSLGVSTLRDDQGNSELEKIVYKKIIPDARSKAFAGADIQPIEDSQTQDEKIKTVDDFIDWFEGSVVAESDGSPMLVFHTTRALNKYGMPLDKLIPGGPEGTGSGKAVWFGTDPNKTQAAHNAPVGKEGSYTIPAYVSIKNPLYLDEFNIDEMRDRWGPDLPFSIADKRIEKLKDAGFDGILYEGKDGLEEVVVFNSDQILMRDSIPMKNIKAVAATKVGATEKPEQDPDWDIPFNIERRMAEPPAYAEEAERRPSLRVGIKRLMKQFNEGKIAPETLTNRIEFELEFTKDKKKPQPRERGAFLVEERLNRAARRGELSVEAVQLAKWFISKNPALLDDLGISIKEPKEGTVASGYYNPMSRIMTLIKHSGNDETAVHEMLHHMERMLPDKVQDAIRKSWFASLAKAAKAADKGSNKELKKFYESVIKYHLEGDRKAMKVAENLLENGDVGYEHYQHINPSEFWAVNAAGIVAGRYDQSKSIVGKLKQWLKELGQKIKSIFGLQSSAPIIRALDSLAKADGRFVNDVMIGEATQYMNRKNYKGGQAPLASWQDPQESKLDNFLYKVQDKLIDTKRVQQAIEKQVGEIDDQWNAYMKEELYHGRTAKRTQDFLKNELAPIVKELAKAGIEIIEFDQFLHNRHAEERNVQIAKINPNMPDAGSGIATADAQQYMKDLDPAKRKLLEKLANKIDDMVQGTQKILIDSGLEEQSTIDAWNSAYKHYVPLKREDVDFVHTGTGLGQGYATRGGTSARATGSLKNVADIFTNLALQRERAIIRSEKARIGKALYALAIKYANPDFWLAVNPDAMKNKAKLEQELVSMGLDPLDAKNLIQEPRQQYIDPRTGLVAWRVNPILRTSDNVFPVRINGQDRFIFFNSSDERAMRMVSALKNLDAEQLDIVLATTANITRWIASVNTQYNPVFGAWNFARDVQGAALNLSTTPLAGKQKEVIKNTIPALKGIYADLRSDGKATGMWADLWEDFQKEGGQTGYRDQFSRNRKQASVVEREMAAMKRGKVRRAAVAVAQWLSDYNDSMENAVRLSAYKTALDMGLSKQQAASIAKNLTVNFNRKGTWSQTVGALYAFFNASVQGTARLAQTMKGPAGRKIFYGGLALGTLQAIALAAAGFDDDEPPEFIKSRNLIIPTGGKKYIAIPMPLGFNLFPNLGRLTTEFVVSGGKKPAQKALDMVSAVFNTFNPIGGSGLQFVAPTIADPAVALYTNVDAFGRPIYKEDRATSPTPGYTRSREQATTVNKYIAEFLNYATGGTKYQKGLLSPTADQLDYLVGQATGGVGRETMKAVGAVKALAAGEDLPSYKVPLVGKLYGNTESPANIASKFYSNVTQLANYENEIKGRQKNRENVAEFLREHPEARLYQRANQLENQITGLNRTKKELIERKAPQKQIEAIEKRKIMLMDKFNKDYKKLAK